MAMIAGTAYCTSRRPTGLVPNSNVAFLLSISVSPFMPAEQSTQVMAGATPQARYLCKVTQINLFFPKNTITFAENYILYAAQHQNHNKMDNDSTKYEDAVKRLEEIVRLMENGQLDLDQITDHLREAKTLVALCKEKLGKTNEDINKLLDQ